MIKKGDSGLLYVLLALKVRIPLLRIKKSGYLLLATGNGGWEEGSHV
jgi:hypothetical protein